MESIVLAVSSRWRLQPQFRKIERFPFRIGRAYDNDLILADDTVSPHHLLIDQDDDGYWVQNLSTENGTRDGNRELTLEREKLQLPLHLTLGHTVVKLLSSNTALPPTRTQIHLTRLSTICSNIRVALALLLVYFVVNIYFTWERLAIWQEWSIVLLDQLFELILPLAVATVTGFISRLLLHSWRFPLQLSIATIALLVNIVLNEMTGILSYFFTNQFVANNIYGVLFVVALTALLSWQLKAFSTLTRRRAGLTSVAIVLPVFLIMELQGIVRQPDFSNQPDMHTLLRAGDVRVANTQAEIVPYVEGLREQMHAAMAEELILAQQRSADSNEEIDRDILVPDDSESEDIDI